MRWRSIVVGVLIAAFVVASAHAFVSPLGFFDPANQSSGSISSSSGGAVQFNTPSNSGLVAALGF